MKTAKTVVNQKMTHTGHAGEDRPFVCFSPLCSRFNEVGTTHDPNDDMKDCSMIAIGFLMHETRLMSTKQRTQLKNEDKTSLADQMTQAYGCRYYHLNNEVEIKSVLI